MDGIKLIVLKHSDNCEVDIVEIRATIGVSSKNRITAVKISPLRA